VMVMRCVDFLDDLPAVGMGFGKEAGMLSRVRPSSPGRRVCRLGVFRVEDVGSDHLPGRHDPKSQKPAPVRHTHTHTHTHTCNSTRYWRVAHQTPGTPRKRAVIVVGVRQCWQL
jgi:hypothetical protein